MYLSNKFVLIYRIIFAAICWFSIILSAIVGSVTAGNPLIWVISYRYYTMQTNLMVALWFIFAIIGYKKPKYIKKISGPIKGAITLYITTTFVFFAILLQFLYHPTGYAAFNNVMLHYLIPISFIIDWILTKTNMRYEWKHLRYWIIYPICYLVFSLLHGTFTGDYLYLFLDIRRIGILWYLISVCFLIGVGLGLASIYIAINRKRTKIEN
ncbi:MAG: Pr6Pr family membrane protein [Promethearchaeota archaeon]